MKLTKILTSLIGAAFFACTFSACSVTINNNAAANNTNKPNTAIVTTNQVAVNNAAPVSNAKPAPSASKTSTKSEDAMTVEGELQTGKTESVILYVGEESGDYAAYCFPNDSDAGRAILAACKDKEQCEVKAEVAPGKCTVPGLEADLSDSGTIVKVESAKKRAAKK